MESFVSGYFSHPHHKKQEQQEQYILEQEPAGFAGLKTFLICSNGTSVQSPLFFSEFLPLIRACNHSL